MCPYHLNLLPFTHFIHHTRLTPLTTPTSHLSYIGYPHCSHHSHSSSKKDLSYTSLVMVFDSTLQQFEHDTQDFFLHPLIVGWTVYGEKGVKVLQLCAILYFACRLCQSFKSSTGLWPYISNRYFSPNICLQHWIQILF